MSFIALANILVLTSVYQVAITNLVSSPTIEYMGLANSMK